MADAPATGAAGTTPAAPKPKSSSLMTFVAFGIAIFVMVNAELRAKLGRIVGYALDPVIGFDHRWPVLTIMIAGALLVLLTTLVRHFTTDWLEQARFQSYMRAFNKELMAARKETNTYKTKKLMDKQGDLLQKQQEVTAKQMKTMPLTMLVVIPLFAWLVEFLTALDYWWYSAPWNAHVDMWRVKFLFPNYILLYMTLSIPLGALVGKAMKYASWKERWARRHPEVHEG